MHEVKKRPSYQGRKLIHVKKPLSYPYPGLVDFEDQQLADHEKKKKKNIRQEETQLDEIFPVEVVGWRKQFQDRDEERKKAELGFNRATPGQLGWGETRDKEGKLVKKFTKKEYYGEEKEETIPMPLEYGGNYSVRNVYESSRERGMPMASSDARWNPESERISRLNKQYADEKRAKSAENRKEKSAERKKEPYLPFGKNQLPHKKLKSMKEWLEESLDEVAAIGKMMVKKVDPIIKRPQMDNHGNVKLTKDAKKNVSYGKPSRKLTGRVYKPIRETEEEQIDEDK